MQRYLLERVRRIVFEQASESEFLEEDKKFLKVYKI